MLKKSAVLIIYSGLFFIAGSCQTPAGRTTGQVVDDAIITTKVKVKLFEDPFCGAWPYRLTGFL